MVLPNKHCCHCRSKVIVAGRTEHTGAIWVLSTRSRCGDACRDAKKRVVPLSSTPWLPREVDGGPLVRWAHRYHCLVKLVGGIPRWRTAFGRVTVAGLPPPSCLSDGAVVMAGWLQAGVNLRPTQGFPVLATGLAWVCGGVHAGPPLRASPVATARQQGGLHAQHTTSPLQSLRQCDVPKGHHLGSLVG